jgi:hypothetical protein
MDNPYSPSRQSSPSASRRPIGVWLTTIWAALVFGLYPLLDSALNVFFDPLGGIDLIQAQTILEAAIALGVIVFAVGAWIGSSAARYGLVVLVCGYGGLSVYNNYYLIQHVRRGLQFPGGEARFWGQALSWIAATLVICIYLLGSRSARLFYGRNEGLPK